MFNHSYYVQPTRESLNYAASYHEGLARQHRTNELLSKYHWRMARSLRDQALDSPSTRPDISEFRYPLPTGVTWYDYETLYWWHHERILWSNGERHELLCQQILKAFKDGGQLIPDSILDLRNGMRLIAK